MLFAICQLFLLAQSSKVKTVTDCEVFLFKFIYEIHFVPGGLCECVVGFHVG